MTLPWITMLWGHVERWAERQVAGRFPFARITIWGLFAAFVLTTFPNYSQINRMFKGEGNIWFWAAIAEKRNDLFKDMLKAYPPGYHESQMTFRILVPAVARALGLGMPGVFVFQSLCGVVLLWAVGRVAHRATGDLVSALFITCGVASTWAGTTSFIEVRGMFDGEALMFVALAALFEVPWLTVAAVFLSGWTDERGLIATSLVYLYHVNRRRRLGDGEIASFFGPMPLAVVVGWAGYFASRLASTRIYGLSTDTHGVSLRSALSQVNNLPTGGWTALEGGWLLVFAAIMILVLGAGSCSSRCISARPRAAAGLDVRLRYHAKHGLPAARNIRRDRRAGRGRQRAGPEGALRLLFARLPRFAELLRLRRCRGLLGPPVAGPPR